MSGDVLCDLLALRGTRWNLAALQQLLDAVQHLL